MTTALPLTLGARLFWQVPGVRAKIGLPKGTRFGPLVGEPLQRHQVSPTAIKKYFWRVSTWSYVWYRLDMG